MIEDKSLIWSTKRIRTTKKLNRSFSQDRSIGLSFCFSRLLNELHWMPPNSFGGLSRSIQANIVDWDLFLQNRGTQKTLRNEKIWDSLVNHAFDAFNNRFLIRKWNSLGEERRSTMNALRRVNHREVEQFDQLDRRERHAIARHNYDQYSHWFAVHSSSFWWNEDWYSCVLRSLSIAPVRSVSLGKMEVKRDWSERSRWMHSCCKKGEKKAREFNTALLEFVSFSLTEWCSTMGHTEIVQHEHIPLSPRPFHLLFFEYCDEYEWAWRLQSVPCQQRNNCSSFPNGLDRFSETRRVVSFRSVGWNKWASLD